MDEKLEITNLEPVEVPACEGNSFVSTALPIAAGGAIAIVGGYLLCRFVVKPLINKAKAKKEEAKAEPAPEKEEKAE